MQGKLLRRHRMSKRAKGYWDLGLYEYVIPNPTTEQVLWRHHHFYIQPRCWGSFHCAIALTTLVTHYDPATIWNQGTQGLTHANKQYCNHSTHQPDPQHPWFLTQGLRLELMVFLPLPHECWDHPWLHRPSSWTPGQKHLFPFERPMTDVHTKKEKCGESKWEPNNTILHDGTMNPLGHIQQGALRRKIAAVWLLWLSSMGA